MENLKVVVIGHKGSGKNTSIARLLYETASLPKTISDEIKKSKACNYEEEFTIVTDRWPKEQPRNSITNMTQIGFRTIQRNYTFIIPPDYKEFLKHISTGTTNADAAILVVDAYKGISRQLCQYAYLIAMYRIREVIVVVNKMDLKLYNGLWFRELSEKIAELFNKSDVQITALIPASALYGDNITTKSKRVRWNSSPTLMKALDYLSAPKNLTRLPLRFLVQCPYITNSKVRILGKIVSGKLFKNHQLTFGPVYHTTKVLSIEALDQEKPVAEAGQSVALGLEDISNMQRGQVGFNACRPPLTTDYMVGDVFWIGTKSLKPGDNIDILCGTQKCSAQVESISGVVDPAYPDVHSTSDYELVEAQVGKVGIKLDSPICMDPFNDLSGLGRFAIFQDDKITGGGIFK